MVCVSAVSHLPQTALLLHVLLHLVPDAALGEQAAPGGLFKLLIVAVLLQGQLHDAHRLHTTHGEGTTHHDIMSSSVILTVIAFHVEHSRIISLNS